MGVSVTYLVHGKMEGSVHTSPCPLTQETFKEAVGGGEKVGAGRQQRVRQGARRHRGWTAALYADVGVKLSTAM